MRESKFEVIRNHDYTITIRDSKGAEIKYRDITGEDLEYIEQILNIEDSEGERRVSLEQIQRLLDFLSVDGRRSGSLTRRVIMGVFNCVKEHILCNYMPKYDWLKTCYGIQNGSFVNVLDMEKVPMTKFVAMAQIHKEAMDSPPSNE